MQNLIALCYQLHLLNDGGEWYLSRNKAAELMKLNANDTSNLSDNFDVLVQMGILEILKSADKSKHQATTYRFIG